MKKMFKKICSIALTLAITATTAISSSITYALDNVSVYHFPEWTEFSENNAIDDKGMMAKTDYYKREDYKMFYINEMFYRANPAFRCLTFVLNEDVNNEEADKRIKEIFDEFYPENNLNDTYEDIISPDYNKNDKAFLSSKTVKGVTTYCVCVAHKTVSSIDDERVVKAKQYSKDFMNKLNEENLISEFYDFGEVYEVDNWGKGPDFRYGIDVDIEKVNEYISENNINCTIENVNDDYYEMKFNDDTDKLEQFLIAADIYEATSIGIDSWYFIEPAPVLIGIKNTLEEEPTEPIEPTESTTENVSDEKITDINVICDMINEFIENEGIPGANASIDNSDEGNKKVIISLDGDTSNGTFTNLINGFIEEKNIYKTNIQFRNYLLDILTWFRDINGDDKINVRDCAEIASKLAKGEELSDRADYNLDGKVNVRDAAALASSLSTKK